LAIIVNISNDNLLNKRNIFFASKKKYPIPIRQGQISLKDAKKMLAGFLIKILVQI
jgi:hypothetical protein